MKLFQSKEQKMKAKLKEHKERALFEVEQDLRYIETFKKDMLDYDEEPARRRMSQLKKKDERTEEEDQELEAVIETISESKGVKNEWEKSNQLAKDLRNYISLL